jgi:DNA-binding transcriptional regulator YdaS (Cro superfamily)
MNLKSWAESERGRAMALAKAIDVPQSFVSKMVNGEKAIPAEHCKAIFNFTGGQVTIPEMRDDWPKYWPELASQPMDSAGAATETIATQGACNV